MLQLVYISSANPVAPVDMDTLMACSQDNNRRDGITGLLYTDGKRFLQVLEGDPARVEETFARITRDSRHRAVVLLHRRTIGEREFGNWSMARRSFNDTRDEFATKIAALCRHADPGVQGIFRGLVEVRQSA